ncbi:hypothetical protein ES708_24933 [subsurface metagenome]
MGKSTLTLIADKIFLFTEPVLSPFAVLAVSAKNERINHDAVTRMKSFNAIPDFIYLAIDLMAKNSGGLGVVDFSRVDMGIGSAHSATEHFDPHLPERRFGNRKILNLDTPWRLEHCSLHKFSLFPRRTRDLNRTDERKRTTLFPALIIALPYNKTLHKSLEYTIISSVIGAV